MRKLLGILAGLALGSMAGPSFADLVQNGGFEDNNAGNPYPNAWTTDAGYNLEAGNFNVVVDNVAGNSCYDGNTCLQFGNYKYEGYAGISQDLSTVSGHTYTETFWFLNGHPGGSNESLEALVNGVIKFSTDGSTDTGQWQNVTFNFTAGNGGTTIEFLAYSDPSAFYLDDISVNDASAVPEPASLALVGTGLFAMAGAMRRRRNRAKT